MASLVGTPGVYYIFLLNIILSITCFISLIINLKIFIWSQDIIAFNLTAFPSRWDKTAWVNNESYIKQQIIMKRPCTIHDVSAFTIGNFALG